MKCYRTVAASVVIITAMNGCPANTPTNDAMPSDIHATSTDHNAVNERYAAYLAAAPTSQKLQRQVLTRFAHEDETISQYLYQKPKGRDHAIMAGLQWLLRFIDDAKYLDPNFHFIALLLNEMRLTKSDLQAQLMTSALRRVLDYGRERAHTFFQPTEKDRWEFISFLRVVEQFPEFKNDYHQAYRELYGDKDPPPYQSDGKDLAEAIKRNDHVVIGDYVLYESFLYEYLLVKTDSALKLPKSNYQAVLNSLKQFDYRDKELGTTQFIDLGYLATHVVFALTNYGQRPMGVTEHRYKVERFLDRSYEKTLHLGYLDLFAEYVECLKIVRPQDPRIEPGETLLLSLQRDNGSWGREQDFSSDAYHAFHPTWAVLTALNQMRIQ